MKSTLEQRRKKRQSSPTRVFQSRNSAFAVFQNNPRKAVFFLGVSLGLLLFAVGVYRSFRVHLPALYSERSTDSYYAMVVAVPSDESRYQLSVVVFQEDGSSSTVKVLSLPPDLMLHASGGFGMYPSSALIGLYAQENQPLDRVAQTIMISLGVDVQDVVVLENVPNDTLQKASAIGEELNSIALSQMFFRVQATTPVFDRVLFWQRVQQVNPVRVEIVDIGSSFTLNHDGVTLLDAVRFDNFAAQKLSNIETLNSRVTVGVFNTTSESGLATRYGRALSTIGVSVLRIDSLTSFQVEELPDVVRGGVSNNKHLLLFQSEQLQDSYQADILRRMVGSLGKEVVSPELTSKYRADIVLLLGTEL